MKLIFEVHCRSIELNNERDVQSKRTRQYVNARIWSEKKQSWKEKKDQGREESPSYDQHVKPRKKMESSSENNHRSSSLVSQSSFEKHAQGAYSLIGSFQSPSTCRLKNGGISSIFTANEANDGSTVLYCGKNKSPVHSQCKRSPFFVYKWLKQMSKWGIPWDSHEASSWDTW